jgi:hypothetical protein
MSVDLLQPMLDAGLSSTSGKRDAQEAVVRFLVGDLRELGLRVGPDPRDHNPFHAAVWGVKKGARKRLVRLFEWVERPDDVVA